MKYIQTYDEINEGFIDDAWIWIKDKAHILLPIAEIGSMFIPVIGPFLAMGFGLGDAALYAKEGDKTSAGISAAFSLLPGIGAIATKIPGIKQLGKEGMEQLGKKVIGKEAGALTKTEREVLDGIGKNQKIIQREVIQSLEQTSANRFNPVSCAIGIIKESFVFTPLNENACGASSKMVKLSVWEPGLIQSMKERVFTRGPMEKFLEVEKTFNKFGSRGINGIEMSNKKSVDYIKKLNNEILDDIREIEKTFNSHVQFGDLPIGKWSREYADKTAKINTKLMNGTITQSEWANDIYTLNKKSMDVIKDRELAWNALIQDGKTIRHNWDNYDKIPLGKSAPKKIEDPFEDPFADFGSRPKGEFGSASKQVRPEAPTAPVIQGPALGKPSAVYHPNLHDDLLKIERSIADPISRKEIVKLTDSYVMLSFSENINNRSAWYAMRDFKEEAKTVMNSFPQNSSEFKTLYNWIYNSKFTDMVETAFKNR